MDSLTARALIALNNRFYAEHAASFSATRSAPWDGWKRLFSLLAEREKREKTLSILDVACGNLRFEQFLSERLCGPRLIFEAVDSCTALLGAKTPSLHHVHFHKIDVLGDALDHPESLAGLPSCDLAVCFGFMHHIPGFELRRRMLNELAAHTKPGGLAVVSFWQFMQDERLARKALRADDLARSGNLAHQLRLAQLDTHDHFLGWQNDPSPLRYCHHFPEEEIDELVASMGTPMREIARYSADGASGTLNRYLALERM